MTDILVVATEWNSAKGGISSFNRSFCTTIAAAGRSVTCFVPSYSPDEAADANQAGVVLLAAKPPPGVRGREALLFGLPGPLDFDAVVGHGRISGPAATGIRSKSNSSAPYVHFLHMDPRETEWEKEPVDGVYPPDVLKQREADEIALAKSAELVYGVGPQLTRSFGAYLKSEGREVEEFCPGLLTCEMATAAGSNMDCLLFGRVEDYHLKGVDIAAKAMAYLIRQRPAEFSIARLTVLGAQPNEGRALQERLEKEASAAKIIVESYTSNRDEVAKAILRSSLVLMPSRTEGFGLAAIEAISHGVPVLMSARSGLAEALVRDVPALSEDHIVSLHLSSPVRTLAERIGDKLSNTDRAFSRAAALRAAMVPNFSWELSVKRFLERLDGLRGRGGRAPASGNGTASEPPPVTPASEDVQEDAGAPSASGSGSHDVSDPTGPIVQQLKEASVALMAWPQTLTTQRWLERPQLAKVKAGLVAVEARRYWLLGAPGSGKSAFLSKLLGELHHEDVAVLGIKADQLPPSVEDRKSLTEFLKLGEPVEDLILAVAKVRRVVVVLDQLDALSDIVDLQTRRLGALLDLLRVLRRSDNVSVIASCRAFDFARDIRFRELSYEEVELAPVAAQLVESALAEAGLVPEAVPAELRELVRVPHWLNVFLRLRQGGSTRSFASYHGLLEDLWVRATRAGGDGSEQLLAEMADSMSEEEVLWLPLAQFADRRDCIDRLEREGLLRREDSQVRVGFAHQTFFEFARARAFVAKRSLSADVRARGYSLFVRPVVWAALGYLREATPKQYAAELSALLNDPDLRMHLRALILQFVGQVERPTPDEQRRIVQAIDDDVTHPIAIKAIFGRVVWFSSLKQKTSVLMTARPTSAALILQGVVSVAQAEVVDLMRRYWLAVPAEHDRIAWTLARATGWEAAAISLVGEIVQGGHLAKRVQEVLLGTAARLVPMQVPKLYAIELNRLLASRLAAIRYEPRPADDAPDTEKMRWEMHQEPRSTLARLLHDAADLPSLGELAKRHPREFLQAIWPWYLEVLDRAAEPLPRSWGFRRVFMYETDPWERALPVFGSVIGNAVRHLAKEGGNDWRAFVETNARSQLDTVHQCILCGFESALPSQSSACGAYLLEDSRRLSIGDHSGSDSVRVFDALAPFVQGELAAGLRSAAEHARLSDESDQSVPVEMRRLRRQVNERHRQRLIQALEQSESADPDDDSETYGRSTGLRLVDSHISAEQMAHMADAHILGLFAELVDATDFTHPTKFMSGGSVQAARVLGEVVRKFPDRHTRYAALSRQFPPDVNQRPAASIFEALLDTGYGLSAGGDLLLKLDELGFRSAEFRWTAAYAIEKVASNTEAVAPEVLHLLESWLSDAVEIETIGDEEKEPRDILWGWGMGGVLPSGNFPTLHAITRLLLQRPTPDPLKWATVLCEHLKRKESPRVWTALAPRLDNLRWADSLGADVLAGLFAKFPQVRDSTAGVRLIAHATWWVGEDLITKWLHGIRASSWRLAQRAYGELVGLLGTRNSRPAWIDAEVAAALSAEGASDCRLGVLTSAANLWDDHESRAKATTYLVDGCRVAQSKEERDAIMRSFDLNKESVLDAQTLALLRALQASPSVLLGRSTTFVERLAKFLPNEPELIAELVASYVEQRLGDQLMDRGELFGDGPVLANIAVTLHRSSEPFRTRGLNLLERLLVSESYGASDVLSDVDRGRL
jgi:glycosyltransferase involved in cell wall biosynthesis